LPGKDLGAGEQIGDDNEPAYLLQPRIGALARQHLINSKGQQPQVDYAPAGKYVSGWGEEIRKIIGNLASGATTDGGNIGKTVGRNHKHEGDENCNLAQKISVHWKLLFQIDSRQIATDLPSHAGRFQ